MSIKKSKTMRKAMSKLLEGTSTVSINKEENVDKRVKELVKTIEGIGEPFYEPIIIANKLGLEQIKKEFNQPNRELPTGQMATFMNGIRIIMQDTDYIGLCKPYSRMYKLLAKDFFGKESELNECKKDFYSRAILKANKQ